MDRILGKINMGNDEVYKKLEKHHAKLVLDSIAWLSDENKLHKTKFDNPVIFEKVMRRF